jgi:hypothetical protein
MASGSEGKAGINANRAQRGQTRAGARRLPLQGAPRLTGVPF